MSPPSATFGKKEVLLRTKIINTNVTYRLSRSLESDKDHNSDKVLHVAFVK